MLNSLIYIHRLETNLSLLNNISNINYKTTIIKRTNYVKDTLNNVYQLTTYAETILLL